MQFCSLVSLGDHAVDLFGQVDQGFSVDGYNERLFLFGEEEALAQISVCQGLLGFAQERFAEVLVNDSGRKYAIDPIHFCDSMDSV